MGEVWRSDDSLDAYDSVEIGVRVEDRDLSLLSVDLIVIRVCCSDVDVDGRVL